MDLTQALKDAENSLRDFIANTLRNKFGNEWIEKCGVSEDRIENWRKRKEVEDKRQETGVVEERLLYYADFYDLKTILKKHWNEFTVALGDWKTMEVWLSELEKLRDPDAHRRELLPHQKHLALGISGEIRTRLVKYRSKHETSEDFFPRIESARDNLGNIYTYGNSKTILTEMTIRTGDTLDFSITASDPLGENLQYRISIDDEDWGVWQDNNTFSVTFSEANIGANILIQLSVKSQREYHASKYFDDIVRFFYTVLPSK
jgi:hypothetical protein